ncbi:MAG: M3 family oligoendopeptidase [Armatimonadetes bacterium]|nr:M3 family oligoendopeptidase [Armatimonadota bacterium]
MNDHLPRWDMSVLYPGLDSGEFRAGFADYVQAIAGLESLFEHYCIESCDGSASEEETTAAFEAITGEFNRILEAARSLRAYIHSFVSTDSRDQAAQARMSELQKENLRLRQLETRYTAWIGSLDVESLIGRSGLAADHAFMLRKAKAEAAHLMSPAEESLAITLSLTGGTAWSKLHGNLTSQIMVSVEIEGQPPQLPMSMVRNLAFDPDREVRRRAYEVELAAWKRNEVPIAAALNSIKGETGVLTRRRGWNSPLNQTLFDSNMDRQALDAMLQAARESFPDFRRYLKAKARALGIPVLAWYDLFAPVGEGGAAWRFHRAEEFVTTQFGTFSEKLRDFASRAFRERWIDAEPREGKRDGAFCMGLRKDESRILMNYKPAFGAVSTLAHELGHAYHNLCLADRAMLQRDTPMTLAETASTFCETIVRQAGLRQAEPQEQLAILEASLQASCQVVVDITGRFLFERQVFEERRARELAPGEFQEIMLAAQRETYGDGLDSDTLHPYMWAAKPHYYMSGLSYYNFPYMFGLLFGLGLYAEYRRSPDTFRASYDDLLASTGISDAASLTARFGFDIRTPGFWRASLGVIRAEIDRFEKLTEGR